MHSSTRRFLLWSLALAYVPLQIWTAAEWIPRHGFGGAGKAFMDYARGDALLMTAVIDLIALQIVAGAWMLAELPAKRRWRPATFAWLVAYVIYPGAGPLLYFLWLFPTHPFMTGTAGRAGGIR